MPPSMARFLLLPVFSPTNIWLFGFCLRLLALHWIAANMLAAVCNFLCDSSCLLRRGAVRVQRALPPQREWEASIARRSLWQCL